MLFYSLRPVVSAPRRSRFLSYTPLLFLMASLLLAAPHAHAGTWQFTCTGSGSETQDTRTPTTDDTSTQNWVPPDPSTGSSFQISGFSLYTQPAAFSTTQANTTKSSNGNISAAVTLTWVPDAGQTATTDPPPTSVLLDESSSASWTAQVDNYPDPYTTGGTSADDGLGDAEVPTYYGSVKNGGISSGSHYSAPALSGGTLTLNRSFSAPATARTGSSDAGVNFGFSFGSYTLAVAAPIIKISGTYDPTHGDYRVLTGQPITATLQGLSGYTVTKYTWAGVSGTCFKTYNEKAASNPLVQLSSTDLTGPPKGSSTVSSLAFYDSKKEDLTVTCTATVLAPDGTTLNITATSPKINVLKPTANWPVPSAAPFVNASGGYGANVVWDPVTISVPPPFNVGSGGLGGFAQLIAPSRQVTRSFPPGTSIMYSSTYYAKVSDGNGGWTLPSNGLDIALPYPFGYTANPDGSPGTQVNGSSYTWNANGGTGISGDRPTAPYSPAVVSGDAGGTNWYTATMKDSFTTWLMYQPPGGVWVPLQKLSWSTNITVTNTSGTWALDPSSTVTSPKTGTAADDPPNWLTVNTASSEPMRP